MNEFAIQLWRAFDLGARTALAAYKVPKREADAAWYINRLQEIASGDQPLTNPLEEALMLPYGDNAEDVRSAYLHECQVLRDDRELARLVLDGMEAEWRLGE
jgi:hypothetical protein